MAQCSTILFLLCTSCLNPALSQKLDYPANRTAPASLIPVLCIILAMVILVLCLVGFCFFCLSALLSPEYDEDGIYAATLSNTDLATGKDSALTHQRDDPSSHHDTADREELTVKLEQKVTHDDHCALIINMEPYGSKLKQTARSLLLHRELGTEYFQHISCQGDLEGTVNVSGIRKEIQDNGALEQCKDVPLRITVEGIKRFENQEDLGCLQGDTDLTTRG